eukprot:4540634-Prymnesium_polylepis.1
MGDSYELHNQVLLGEFVFVRLASPGLDWSQRQITPGEIPGSPCLVCEDDGGSRVARPSDFSPR